MFLSTEDEGQDAAECFRHSPATFLIAKASTTLDLYSQAMNESKLAAQRDIALATTGGQPQVN